MSDDRTYHIVERDNMTGWERHFWVSNDGLTESEAEAEIERLGRIVPPRYSYRKEADGMECKHGR